MLPVFKNSWFPTVFDEFFDNDLMPRANTTAPAVNVKEDEKAYTMELAAPGIRKEFCRVNINEDGNLNIAIENKTEHKDEDHKHHYLRREFCCRMLYKCSNIIFKFSAKIRFFMVKTIKKCRGKRCFAPTNHQLSIVNSQLENINVL